MTPPWKIKEKSKAPQCFYAASNSFPPANACILIQDPYLQRKAPCCPRRAFLVGTKQKSQGIDTRTKLFLFPIPFSLSFSSFLLAPSYTQLNCFMFLNGLNEATEDQVTGLDVGRLEVQTPRRPLPPQLSRLAAAACGWFFLFFFYPRQPLKLPLDGRAQLFCMEMLHPSGV